MTERDRREDAPRGEEGRAADSPQGKSAPRSVGEARRERETELEQREAERGTSWIRVLMGMLAALLGVLVTVLVVAIGAVAGFGISDNLSGVVLPDLPEGGEQGLGSLLALSAVSGVLALLVPFIGGAMGGA